METVTKSLCWCCSHVSYVFPLIIIEKRELISCPVKNILGNIIHSNEKRCLNKCHPAKGTLLLESVSSKGRTFVRCYDINGKGIKSV